MAAKKSKKTKPVEKPPGHWSDCYLEHAARETAWMAQHAKDCNYLAAHTAQIRREVWLYAALLAKEQHK